MAAAAEKYDAAVKAVLTPEQEKRYPQLVVQYDSAASLSDTLRQPDVVKQLGLTPEQLEKIAAAAAEGDQLASLLAAEPLPPARRAEIGGRLRDRVDDRLVAVLTPAQKDTWKAMTGEPAGFRKTPLGSPRFGGAGGLGGGGIGGPGGP